METRRIPGTVIAKRTTRVYSLHGIILQVTSDTSLPEQVLDAIFHYFGWYGPLLEPSPEVDIELVVVHTHQEVPSLHTTCPIVEYNGVVFQRGLQALSVTWEDTRLYVDVPAQKIWAYLPPDKWADVSQLTIEHLISLMHGVLVLVRKLGFFPLHAAAVAQGEDAVLFCGPKGSGKTTMAYALVQQGMRFLSDDSILLEPEDTTVYVRPLRRYFAFTTEDMQKLERVRAAFQIGARSKWYVDVSMLYEGQEAERAIPVVLIFPEIVQRERSRLLPLSSEEAMQRLIGQAGLLSLPPDLATKHLHVLSQLVRQVDAYSLEAGQDVYGHPDVLESFIEPLLSTSTKHKCHDSGQIHTRQSGRMYRA